jgi:hypothetical protein
MKEKREFNVKVIVYSVIGLICLALAFFVHWAFIIGSAIVIWLNQRELSRKR